MIPHDWGELDYNTLDPYHIPSIIFELTIPFFFLFVQKSWFNFTQIVQIFELIEIYH